MENYSNEIGQKMRSAVKAKLLELGTGGSTAYIDDELPDYVMIMVANKRSKQQMASDLNLFLGKQTELFVTWLHEVLQKLQEVTLPSSSVSTKKQRKSHTSTSETTTTLSKQKDKKNLKKDKKSRKRSEDENDATDVVEKPTTTTDASLAAPINTIIAEELLEKAKKTMDVTTSMKEDIKKKKRKNSIEQQIDLDTSTTTTTTSTQQQHNRERHDFDIPTISEITSTTEAAATSKDASSAAAVTQVTTGNREKDLAELAEIQKKIYAAKKHLRKIGEIIDKETDDDDDEDFLNLKDDEQQSVGDYDLAESTEDPNTVEMNFNKKAKSPIIYARHSETSKKQATEHVANTSDTAVKAATHEQHERERKDKSVERIERRSVHERLGTKPTTTQNTERRSRQQKELYVPAHLRKEQHSNDNDNRHTRDSDRTRQKETNERSRRRTPSRERNQRTDNIRQESTSRKRRSSPTPTQTTTERGRQRQHTSMTAADESRPKQRIVSHVIVAPSKIIESSDNDDINDKPVNSIIKVKPRPPVSPSRQACKNLLLRAMADAQRSTILSKTELAAKQKSIDPDTTSSATNERSKSLYTKAYREANRTKRIEPSAELFRRTTRNLRVELNNSKESFNQSRNEVASMENEEYVPKMIIDDADVLPNEYNIYVPLAIERQIESLEIEEEEDEVVSDEAMDIKEQRRQSTKFVVTLHGDNTLEKYRKRKTLQSSHKRTSLSPLPQVSSSSASLTVTGINSIEPSSTTGERASRQRLSAVKSRISTTKQLTTTRKERSRSNSPTSSNTPPPATSNATRNVRRSDVLNRSNEIKKIIIQHNESDEDEDINMKRQTSSPNKRQQQQQQPTKRQFADTANGYKKNTESDRQSLKSKKRESSNESMERSTTPPMPPVKQARLSLEISEKNLDSTVAAVEKNNKFEKSKHIPIKYTIKNEDTNRSKSPIRERSRSRDSDKQRTRVSSTERRRISIRTAEDKKYENIPSLSSVAVDSVLKTAKPKERCKYHPNCTKQFCDYYHPTAPCKSFPNCKYADKCLYSHPKCKFDLACMSVDCNFAHSGPRDLSHAQLTAPPLSSHVIPVQNYKSITASATTGQLATMCKFFPHCAKAGCTFYHPKPCRYGKNCINKLECVYFHPEMQSSNKFKWVATI